MRSAFNTVPNAKRRTVECIGDHNDGRWQWMMWLQITHPSCMRQLWSAMRALPSHHYFAGDLLVNFRVSQISHNNRREHSKSIEMPQTINVSRVQTQCYCLLECKLQLMCERNVLPIFVTQTDLTMQKRYRYCVCRLEFQLLNGKLFRWETLLFFQFFFLFAVVGRSLR